MAALRRALAVLRIESAAPVVAKVSNAAAAPPVKLLPASRRRRRHSHTSQHARAVTLLRSSSRRRMRPGPAVPAPVTAAVWRCGVVSCLAAAITARGSRNSTHARRGQMWDSSTSLTLQPFPPAPSACPLLQRFLKVLAADPVDPICAQTFADYGHKLVEKKMNREQLLEVIGQYDGLVVRSGVKVTEDVRGRTAAGGGQVGRWPHRG